VAIGRGSLNVTNGSNTVAVGYFTGALSSSANATYFGTQAGRANQNTGHVSIGYQAGYSQTSGSNNTNLGFEAGYSNTTGAFRTMLGYQAGKSQTGGANTFIGSLAGGSRSGSGTQNVAIGNNALRYLENADNTAIGSAAGQYADSTSSKNVIIGSQAMAGAFGSKSQNVAVGYKAGFALTTANNNTLVGNQAGVAVTGAENTLIGTFAGRTLTSGTTNTMVGVNYNGGGVTTGSNNILLGNNATATSTSVSNEITLGNSSVTSLRCAVTSITSLSDERDKSEIKDLEYGLAFIDALQPREFVWDNRLETRTEFDEEGNETEVEFYSANKGKKDFGFIAQEVRELDNDTLRLVYSENEDKLELSYGKLVPILVKAIQELKEEVELLKS